MRMNCIGNAESKHELKVCPRCGKAFECKPGDIANCQCYGVKVSEKVTAFIAKKYGDCLCIACLQELNLKQTSS